jgi:hypothetical protein
VAPSVASFAFTIALNAPEETHRAPRPSIGGRLCLTIQAGRDMEASLTTTRGFTGDFWKP